MVPQGMRRWGGFLFPWLCPEKEGGILEAHAGEEPRSAAGRPASEARAHRGALALQRDGRLRASPRFFPSARSRVDGLDAGAGGASVVPVASRPHLRSSCARPPTRQRAVGEPPALPAREECERGSWALRDARYPGRKTAPSAGGTQRRRPRGAGRRDRRPERANAAPGRGFALRWADERRPS